MSRLLFVGVLLLSLAPFPVLASTLTDSLDRELSLLRQESQTLSELKTETQKNLVESKENLCAQTADRILLQVAKSIW